MICVLKRREEVQLLWKIIWRFLRKLNIDYHMITLLGIYPDKTTIQKDSHTPMFIATLFTISNTWKQPKCPLTDEWIKMQYAYIYIHSGIVFSHKKEQNNGICNNMMQLEILIISEVSQKKTNTI